MHIRRAVAAVPVIPSWVVRTALLAFRHAIVLLLGSDNHLALRILFFEIVGINGSWVVGSPVLPRIEPMRLDRGVKVAHTKTNMCRARREMADLYI